MGVPSPAPHEDTLDGLVRHIIDRHHAYVRASMPQIMGTLDTLIAEDRGRHSELIDVRRTFRELVDALAPHMVKEEHILFPYIQDLALAVRTGTRPSAGPFGTLLNPIRVMESEHHVATLLAERLRSLTGDYAVPADATDLFRRCYGELATFEADLQEHVHLENDVLFPGAMALERRVS